ncbi:hypothetical protein Celaphus_00016457 [Cervus elaphus hippelaphus]|uniref:Lactate/malate dehydrogenase C-terminal domain-containing protein n=1 Tax=Cervus elaphus hippelaphus TaxID=46360 RepID=A0A212CEJ3_CEREH|nr:hypothetical protein Celaphus_00016457 [Cervus elaphus hippelaphus]
MPGCSLEKHAKKSVMVLVEALKDDSRLKGGLLMAVQQHGTAVIKAWNLSSAVLAAKAICDHFRHIQFGIPKGEFVSFTCYLLRRPLQYSG